MYIRVEMDEAKEILKKRGMEKDGRANLFLANELRRRSDKYVPFRAGILKNTAIVRPGQIIYNTPYARRQWYEHKGNGLRGKQWCMRCWTAEGHEITVALASFVGGKAE